MLMDQTFVSGLGNIYVNEVLFKSQIHPLRISGGLSIKEIKKIIQNIKKVLNFSISKGGSSIKDFKNTGGKKGQFQEFFRVTGRVVEKTRCQKARVFSCFLKAEKTRAK